MHTTHTDMILLQNTSLEIRTMIQSAMAPSEALWALRLFDQAIGHAIQSRGVAMGRLAANQAFCDGFAASGHTPVTRLVGAELDRVQSFLAGAALRDYVEGLDLAIAMHEVVDELRTGLQAVRRRTYEAE